MTALDEVIQRIESYPSSDIPVKEFASMVNIKQDTIANQARLKVIQARFDGYKYHIPKDVAINIANRHKSAILGWTKQIDLKSELSIQRSSIFWLCQSLKLTKEKDYLGNVRFPKETILVLKEILPYYLSRDILNYEGRLYYSAKKLAHDMAKKVEPDHRLVRFKNEKERIYQCIYSWCKRDLISHVFVRGAINLYVTDFAYNELVNMVRIKDACLISDRSKRTIYNWIDQGILTKSKSPSGSTLINTKDLDNTLIFKTQLNLMKKYVDDSVQMTQVGEFESPYWNKEITSLRTLRATYGKENNIGNTVSKNKHVESLDGWSKEKIRIVDAVSKRRKRTDEISLDGESHMNEPNDSNDPDPIIDHMEDESIPSPYTMAELDDIDELVMTLPSNEKELVQKVFGMGDYDVVTWNELSKEYNVSTTVLVMRLKRILDKLRKELE